MVICVDSVCGFYTKLQFLKRINLHKIRVHKLKAVLVLEWVDFFCVSGLVHSNKDSSFKKFWAPDAAFKWIRTSKIRIIISSLQSNTRGHY